MLSSLMPTVYVQLSPQRLTIRNVKTGASVSEIPEIAIARDPKPRILGVGAEARLQRASGSVEITNPFAHPRSLVSDFTSGEQVLKALLRRVLGNSLFAVSPKIVMHPMGDLPEGGFTQVEIRALQEMALGAGAAKVTVWQGRALSDQELVSGRYPANGQVLE